METYTGSHSANIRETPLHTGTFFRFGSAPVSGMFAQCSTGSIRHVFPIPPDHKFAHSHAVKSFAMLLVTTSPEIAFSSFIAARIAWVFLSMRSD
jgi:hypothetical protein